MSTTYLDPPGMDATAAAIGERAQQLLTLTSTLEAACSATMPASLAGWLADELHAIAVQAQLGVIVYTVGALDTALRAQQIQADQSLVAAHPGPATTSVDLGAALAASSTIGGPTSSFDIVDPSGASVDLGAALEMGSAVGGTQTAFVNDFPGLGDSVVGGQMPLEISDVPRLGPTVVGAATQSSLSPLAAAILAAVDPDGGERGSIVLNSRPGADYVGDGLFEGSHGRVGPTIYRRPDGRGEHDV